ncbi:proprotein convertase subtilisin/kexin type 5-like [Mercenaria mercenaria]|uniref:proprotein convertase subtilisin/kexin type 5-like n=1 Tax=Mercenaria mercenaria TaxID=6596 RepID=UPI00234F54B3|nr:proprotein convertase subtilisin/kexin type 5-like [Mercenaria mercenaria]
MYFIITCMVFKLSLIFLAAKIIFACDEICPLDKPYCSDAGCISDCPEPFYINGSDCVGDCRNMFVTENRTCVDSCPNNTYSKETLKQVYATQYLERKCITCSNEDEYIMNNTCVNMCPEKWRTIDQNHCKSDCPGGKPFKLKKTISNIIHFDCVSKCPRLEDNGICVDTCSTNKVMFGSSCLINCPSSDPILKSNECISECPSPAMSPERLNSTCIYQCPADKPFVLINRCVSQCPGEAKLKMYKDGATICVDKCQEVDYRHNDFCLNTCPDSTVSVNNSCVHACPRTRSFSCKVKNGHICGTNQKELDHTVCVHTCSENMYILNSSCVYTCPYGMPVFNKECSDICPVDNPYLYNRTVMEGCSEYDGCKNVRYLLKCIGKCPDDSYVYNNVCMNVCPNNTFYNDYTCVEQCPHLKNLTQSSSLTFHLGRYKDINGIQF